MAQDIVINGQTYENIESINMINSNGETIMYYPDAVRYNEQSLTSSQQMQALANLGILGVASSEDSDNGKVVTISTTQDFSGALPNIGFTNFKWVKLGKLVIYSLGCYINLNSAPGDGSGIFLDFPDTLPISNGDYHAAIGLPCSVITDAEGAWVKSNTRRISLINASGTAARFRAGATGLNWISIIGFYCTNE